MGLITHPHTSHNQSNWGITALLVTISFSFSSLITIFVPMQLECERAKKGNEYFYEWIAVLMVLVDFIIRGP